MPETSSLLPTGLNPRDAARVGAAIEAERAASTRRAYASAWRGWERWCEGRGIASMPAQPAAVAAYLAERAEAGASVSTLNLACAALRYCHLDKGLDDPTAHEAVGRVRRGLRRLVGVAPRRQAHPLGLDEVRRIVAHVDRSTAAGARDVALILFGFASALRRSELAALTVADVEWRPAGLLVAIRRSKGDQEGRSQVIGVARGQHTDTDPVAALHAWLKARGVEAGPLFTRVRRGDNVSVEPLSGAAIGGIVATRASQAGLPDLRVSGHSLRSGHATAAAQAGVGLDRIAAQTRHRQIDTLLTYVRPVEVLTNTSSAGLGL